MALLTDKSLFIHVQKTAGMTVRRALRMCMGCCYESGVVEVERHYGLPELLAAHPGVDSGRFKFGFVRHPVAWIKSRWSWAVMSSFTSQAKHRPSAAMLWINSCWSDDYEVFVKRYLERYPGVYTQTCFRMLGLWSDTPVDFIGRVETFADDLVEALYKAGEVFDESKIRALPRFNRSIPDPELSVSLELAITEAERPVVDRFYR